jgi:NADH-quinone oxidoreductase subunit N
MDWESPIILALYPELYLAFCIVVFLFINSVYCFYYEVVDKTVVVIETTNLLSQVLAIHVGLLILYVVSGTHEGVFHEELASNILMSDESCRYTKMLFICISTALIIPITYSFDIQRTLSYEFFFMYLCILLSGLLLISSTDLMFTYLLLELQTLSLYVLAAFNRKSIFSAEAAIKYFFAGSFFSGIYLFGCAIIYLFLGTMNLEHILLLLTNPAGTFSAPIYALLLWGIICIFCALLFKLAAAPFHFWAVDVYEGAPLASTMVLAVVPKLPVFYFLIRWLSCVHDFEELKILFFVVGFSSVLVGGIMAMQQVRLKRLLIFSSVGQMGYIILTLADYSVNSASYSLFCLIIYLFSTIIAWCEYSLFAGELIERNRGLGLKHRPLFVSDLTGLFKTNKITALIFTILFFSMSGIPGLIGFFGKTLPLLSVVEGGSFFIALVSLLASSLSVFYTLRIMKIIYFDKDDKFSRDRLFSVPPADPLSISVIFLSLVLTSLILITFIRPSFLLLFCDLIITSSTFF